MVVILGIMGMLLAIGIAVWNLNREDEELEDFINGSFIVEGATKATKQIQHKLKPDDFIIEKDIVYTYDSINIY